MKISDFGFWISDFKTVSRFIVLLLVAHCSLLIAHNSFAQQHRWYNGYVKEISKETIKINDNSYTIDSKVKVVKHTSKKGLISENTASLTEVKAGDKVSLKLIGDVIKEIIIERY